MAGYSGTPLVKKLGIKPGHRVALVNAPPGFAQTLKDLPADVELRTDSRSEDQWDVILCFARHVAELTPTIRDQAARLTPAGALWICWPKKAARIATDLTEGVVQQLGLKTGLVDNKVCAVDETWSGLRFVIRLVDRPGVKKKAR